MFAVIRVRKSQIWSFCAGSDAIKLMVLQLLLEHGGVVSLERLSAVMRAGNSWDLLFY